MIDTYNMIHVWVYFMPTTTICYIVFMWYWRKFSPKLITLVAAQSPRITMVHSPSMDFISKISTFFTYPPRIYTYIPYDIPLPLYLSPWGYDQQ